MKNVCLPLNTLIKQQLEFQIGTKNTDFNMKFIAALALALSCYFRTTDGSKLVVGVGLEESSLSSSFEVINLESNDGSCVSLPNFPHPTYGAVAGTSDGVALVCGGLGDKPDEFSNDCYTLKDKSWVKTNKLKLGRAYAALAKLDDDQLIISGGQTGPGGYESITGTVEHLSDEQWKQDFADLPSINYFHCMANLNSSAVIAIGGVPSPLNPFADRGTFIYNLQTNSWTKGPELLTGRYHHSCGKVKSGEDGEFQVVVAGGVDGEGKSLKTVEILDLTSGAWKSGPELPYPVFRSAMADDDDDGSVILVGGQSKEQDFLNGILRLDDAKASSWTELPQKLKNPRYFHVAFFADDDQIDC